jgi:hypothetical protein
MFMRSALFWDVTRRRVVIVYRRFETTSVSSSRTKSQESYSDSDSTREDGTDTLSRNVGKQLPYDAA